jgi:LSD1 subclass zinc finger protein
MMNSGIDCGVCAKPLVYATQSVTMRCAFCGKEEKTLIYCPDGHYICDSCHSKAAVDVLRGVLASTKTTDPLAIIEQVMSHPSVPMHGPEHHLIVPGAIVAAVRNSGYPLPDGAIEKALERASKVPGGWCGLYGDCGAAVGVGIAVSVITGATPLTGKQRTQALGATSFALSRMLDDQPRCCKRASRIAVTVGIEYLRDRLNITLPRNSPAKCSYVSRNKECPRQACPFFSE